MSAFDLRPMSAGEVLDRSFQLYRAHFLPLFLTAFLVFVPVGLMYAAAGIATNQDPTVGEAMFSLVLVFVTMVATAFAWAAITWQVEWSVTGERVSVGRGFRHALRAAPRLLLLWVVLYVLLLAMIFAAVIPAGVVIGAGTVLPDTVGTVLAVVGVLVALVVATWAMIWWGGVATAANPALVLERTGVLGALKRGSALSKGARIRLGVIMSLASLIVMLPTVGALLMTGLASTLWDPAAAAELSSIEVYVQQLVVYGVGSLTTPWMVAVMVLLYYDRRIRREGLDVELASRELVP